MWRWRYHRCYPSLWLFTFNLDSSIAFSFNMLLIAARCDCRVHFLYCFFIQRILCTKKNRPCGSQDSRKYQYAEDNSCIDTLRLGNRAGNKTCSCQYIPRNRSSESLRHFCNKRCKRCDRRFCTFSESRYCMNAAAASLFFSSVRAFITPIC